MAHPGNMCSYQCSYHFRRSPELGQAASAAAHAFDETPKVQLSGTSSTVTSHDDLGQGIATRRHQTPTRRAQHSAHAGCTEQRTTSTLTPTRASPGSPPTTAVHVAPRTYRKHTCNLILLGPRLAAHSLSTSQVYLPRSSLLQNPVGGLAGSQPGTLQAHPRPAAPSHTALKPPS